jgi:MSHA biogenesis protein MshJ
MRDRWQAIVERFGALSLRERVLVLIALFAVAYQVGTLVVFDRQFEQIEALNAQIARDNTALLAVSREMAAAVVKIPEDPNPGMRTAIQRLGSTLDAERAELVADAETLISPPDMARFLEALLLQESGLELLALQTLPAERLQPPAFDGPAEGSEAGALHRHAFDITFSGGYLATLRYLEALEALPWRFFWDDVDYQVVDHPRGVVRLRLHTLGLSEDWIGV